MGILTATKHVSNIANFSSWHSFLLCPHSLFLSPSLPSLLPSRQVSIQKQSSIITEEEQKKLEEKQEEWDKEIPSVPLSRVLKLNLREWWIIALGLCGAALAGPIWPLFGLIFGEVLDVFARPHDEVLDHVHSWGALLIAVGVACGLGNFIKVSLRKVLHIYV